MSIANHDQRLLEAIKTEFQTGLATALADIDTDGGPTLAAPAAADFEVLDDLDRVKRYPHCGFTVSSPENITWQTHQRDSNPTVKIAVTIAPTHDKAEQSDSDARYYARAIEATLTRLWIAGTLWGPSYFDAGEGLWNVEIDEVDQEQVGEDRNRRRGFVLARLWSRTSQETS